MLSDLFLYLCIKEIQFITLNQNISNMSSITTIKTLRTIDITLIHSRFITLFIGIIMMACANTCVAQETELFKLVKNVTELQDGDIVIVVNNIVRDNGHCSALGTTISDDKSKICGCKIEVNEEIAYATPDVDRIKLEKSSTDNWLLYSMEQQKYICNGNKKTVDNKIVLLNQEDDSFKHISKTEISIDKNNNAIIQYPYKKVSNKEIYPKCILAFNYIVDDLDPNFIGYFTCYDIRSIDESDRMVQLYKKIPSTPLTLNDENDNSGLLTANNRLQTAVKLSRKLLANQWNTFCVPFDIDVIDGKINGIEASVMEYDHTTGNTMKFKEATKIEAGKAYLVKPSADITNPQFDNVTIKNDDPTVSGDANGYSFVGIYNPKTFSGSDQKRVLILASEAKFMKVKNGLRMKGMRAYFTIPAGTKAEAVRLMINNRPTALTEITTTPSTSEKIFYIDGTYAGSDIKNVKKGIVIKGGKKYLMK